MKTAEELNARVSLEVVEDIKDAQTEFEDASDDEQREFWTNQIATYRKCQEGLELSRELAEVRRVGPIQLEDHKDLVQRIDVKHHLLCCIKTSNSDTHDNVELSTPSK